MQRPGASRGRSLGTTRWVSDAPIGDHSTGELHLHTLALQGAVPHSSAMKLRRPGPLLGQQVAAAPLHRIPRGPWRVGEPFAQRGGSWVRERCRRLPHGIPTGAKGPGWRRSVTLMRLRSSPAYISRRAVRSASARHSSRTERFEQPPGDSYPLAAAPVPAAGPCTWQPPPE